MNATVRRYGLTFEWDTGKAASNVKKHNVDFEEAVTCWNDPWGTVFEDQDHSWEEERLIRIAFSSKLNLLLVCHCYREEGDIIRIVSARKATKNEEAYYGLGRKDSN